MFDRIAHNKINDLNEYEQEIVAEMIRKGYIILRNDKIVSAMPIYTKEQWDNMINLQKETVEEIGEIFNELRKVVINVLKNHVPTHLKHQVEDISAMSLFNDGTYVPAAILNKNNYLSSDWTPNEISTSYAVMR